MRNMLKIALEGAFTNFKRIFFAADRVTDMEMRKQISTLSVKPEKKKMKMPVLVVEAVPMFVQPMLLK